MNMEADGAFKEFSWLAIQRWSKVLAVVYLVWIVHLSGTDCQIQTDKLVIRRFLFLMKNFLSTVCCFFIVLKKCSYLTLEILYEEVLLLCFICLDVWDSILTKSPLSYELRRWKGVDLRPKTLFYVVTVRRLNTSGAVLQLDSQVLSSHMCMYCRIKPFCDFPWFFMWYISGNLQWNEGSAIDFSNKTDFNPAIRLYIKNNRRYFLWHSPFLKQSATHSRPALKV